MTTIDDDRSPIVIPFILRRLAAHRRNSDKPFFIGLNGLQGIGKTTLVTALETALRNSPYNIPTLTLSIDDLYLPHEAQQELASTHPNNPLIQHRGQPGTHDLPLARSLFKRLHEQDTDIRVPTYDKAAFDGKGDRAPESTWRVVNGAQEAKIEAVIFEGWCVGFRPLEDEEVYIRWWEDAQQERGRPGSDGRLGLQRREDLLFVNARLREYDVLTDMLDAFVHIDAEDTHYVYPWRLESEVGLRASRGRGMTDEQVMKFVDGYYPSYELFIPTLRRGIFHDEPGKQLRIVVDRQRRLVKHEII